MTASWPDLSARALVNGLARTPSLLVALDFDGTLAPLVDEPMEARALPVAAAAVAKLTALPATYVAFVSGRTLHDLRIIAEHAEDSRIMLAGSHGAEYWIPGTGRLHLEDDPTDLEVRDLLRAEAQLAVARRRGVWIEPKTFGFAVHTRKADAAAAKAANDEVDLLVRTTAPHWRRRTGHDIVEYAFRHEGKDTAVAELRKRVGATAALFAGDDVTDEDALRSLHELDLGVRVGDGETAARVRVTDIEAMADLLTRLAAERAVAGE